LRRTEGKLFAGPALENQRGVGAAKPKEFDSAYSTEAFRAVFGT